MADAAEGPERVTSAEEIEVSVREAQSAMVPRDTGRWAAKVDRLAVEQRDGVRGTNVAGRRLTGPVQGFGQMWQKTYRMTVGDTVSPEQAIATWKAHFPEFWPKGNRFAGALTGISPGDVALLDLAIGGGVKLSTGVFVLYADDESFTLMTPQGHMFAGWITFSAERSSAATAVQAQVLMRANDPLYEVAMTFGGHAKEDKFWAQTLTALGEKLGVPAATVQTRTVCVDSRRQWRNARNVWHNSMIRSVLQTMAAPFTALRRRDVGEADAVIVGSGPNGLAAAVTLSAAGLRVHVIEGAATPGGGCRTEELTRPGFHHDLCAAGHPLALASPFFRRFDLPARGVRFAHPEVVFAHPLDGGRAAVVTRSVPQTAARLGPDAGTYRRLLRPLTAHAEALSDGLLSSMRRPPRHPAVLAAFARNGLRGATSVARRFRTPEARGLIAGISAHAMMPLSCPPTAGIGLMFGALAHAVGWPVVEGGSGRIADAMIEAIVAAGGEVETGRWVRSLDELPSAQAVLLDVTPRGLLAMAGPRLPGRYRDALHAFRFGAGVCKVDFALSGPVPWANPACRRAGTLHLGGTFAEVASGEEQVAAGGHPDFPYVIAVQPGVADATRAPGGQQTLWAYCHVPSGSAVDMTARIEAQIERFAPGFRDLVLARATRTAADEEAGNPNYVGGDVSSGLQTVRQTLARPVARWNPYRTPLPGVYLCSASTPPGPGVHGRCGELAALTALRDVFGVRHPPDLGVARPVPAARARSAP